jgi:C-terminal peptidase prc
MGLGLLLAAGSAWAANPRDAAPRSASESVESHAAAYAQQILSVAHLIEERYVKPIPKAKVVEAALEGIYEAVREPLPNWVKSDLARAKDHNQLLYILSTARSRLGDREALRDQRAVMISLRAIPRVLDPYCGIANLNDRRTNGQAMASGVGIEFESTPMQVATIDSFSDTSRQPQRMTTDRGPARVSQVYPGGPAQRAGIRPGDVLTHIDGKPLYSLEGAEQVQRLFNFDPVNRVKLKLTFRRSGRDKPIEVELDPLTFKVETVFGVRRRKDQSWDYMLDRERRIGYVRLGFIDHDYPNYPNSGTDSEMEEVLQGLKAQGMRALILDLRGNPGGFVDPATNIAGLFIKSGTIAVITDRQDGQTRHALDNGSGLLEGVPTIVLIDEETRGGGEMIAAVLQDHKVAKIAGRRSYGKGSVQKSEILPGLGNMYFKLTTGTFTRPNGKNLHRFPDSKPGDDWGIRPDPGYEFPVPPDVARQVKVWMQQQVLRPGPSRELLPLDDPDNDPLRQFAWRKLVKQLSSNVNGK